MHGNNKQQVATPSPIGVSMHGNNKQQVATPKAISCGSKGHIA